MKALGQIFGLVFLLFLGCPVLAGTMTNNEGAISQTDQERLARQTIVRRLDRIRLPEIRFDSVSLKEAVRQLNEAAKQYDPEKKGVVITIATNEIDGSITDVNSTVVKISQLTDVRLADVLDAILLVASQPLKYHIQSDGVVFSARAAAPQLYSRSFKVDPGIFYSNLVERGELDSYPKTSGFSPVPITSSPVVAAVRGYFTQLGVNFESPPGKSIFYNERVGRLYVKATKADLDMIERVVSNFNADKPHIHIKARFIKIPKTIGGIWRNELTVSNVMIQVPVSNWQSAGSNVNFTTVTTNTGLWWVSVLVNKNATARLKYLKSQIGVEWLAEPECTSFDGLPIQVRATSNRSSGSGKSRISGPANVGSYSPYLETGPTLDVLVNVLSDGYTINANIRPTVIDFANDQQSTNVVTANSLHNERFPLMLNWQATATVALWDGQTIIIGGLPVPASYNGPGLSSDSKELLIFITFDMVDNTGKPIHSEADLPFAQKKAPPQPK